MTEPTSERPSGAQNVDEQFVRLRDRPLPQWFSDAKLGIFVHWTAATVPAFAPLGPDPFTLAEERGWHAALAETPYVEWYENSAAIPGSPANLFHTRTYGPSVPYADFVAKFRQTSQAADVSQWADLFALAGAKYAVLVTKHHDGVLLWPSATPNPNHHNWSVDRDIVGDFATAVRAKDLTFGTYYSGGLDWTFIGPTTGHPIDSFEAMIAAIPQDEAYAAYANAHWRELVERYEPSVLWNDIGFPKVGNMHDLFEWYYARIAEGVVNDRFDLRGVMKGRAHADFRTPEYSGRTEIDLVPWETTRGIGTSFGYNADATDADLIAPDDLLRFFIDTVAKGGNLLLNVGPNADGEIPWNQASRLHALGGWLRVNGDAIYGTRPWVRHDGTATSSDHADATAHDVRFTRRGDDLFAIVHGRPHTHTIVIEAASLAGARPPTDVSWLGRLGSVAWERRDDGRIVVTLPVRPADAVAMTLALRGAA